MTEVNQNKPSAFATFKNWLPTSKKSKATAQQPSAAASTSKDTYVGPTSAQGASAVPPPKTSLLSAVNKKFVSAKDSAVAFYKKHPNAVIAGALGVGLVAGVLLCFAVPPLGAMTLVGVAVGAGVWAAVAAKKAYNNYQAGRADANGQAKEVESHPLSSTSSQTDASETEVPTQTEAAAQSKVLEPEGEGASSK